MTDQSRLEYLLEQYFSRRCANAERLELLRLVQEGTHAEAIKTWMDASWSRLSVGQRLGDAPSEAILAAILGEQTASVVPIEEIPERGNRRWWGWAAAVILVLATGTGSYLYFARKTQPLVAHPTLIHDAVPGRNSAILTLSGGRQVILDSTARGMIGRQGNTTVTNTNGQLVYTALHESPSEIQYNTLTTQRGNQYEVILPDGTRVWLNAASSITYPTAFSGKERSVVITGEAYFEVRHSGPPFRARAGNLLIEDLGTHFDVNAYLDEPVMKTTLLEGSARMGGLVLHPGEQVDVDSGGKITLLKNVDVDDVIAWKEGKFRYSGADIESIMRQAARWYDVDVEYEGKINETFSGGISRNVNASQLLHILEITQKVHFDIEGKKIIVRPVRTN